MQTARTGVAVEQLTSSCGCVRVAGAPWSDNVCRNCEELGRSARCVLADGLLDRVRSGRGDRGSDRSPVKIIIRLRLFSVKLEERETEGKVERDS